MRNEKGPHGEVLAGLLRVEEGNYRDRVTNSADYHKPRTTGKYIGILELARKETEAARMDLIGKGILEPGGDDVFDRADEMFPPPPYDLSTLVSESILENPLPFIRRAERKNLTPRT